MQINQSKKNSKNGGGFLMQKKVFFLLVWFDILEYQSYSKV